MKSMIYVAVGCALVLAAGCTFAEVKPVVSKPVVLPLGAKPVAVVNKNAVTRFIAKAPQEAQLASQMSGKLLRYLVQEGASFRKGDRLVEFDCSERQAQLDRAKASYDKAEKVEISQKQLRTLKAISDLDYDIASANLREAKADVDLAQAQVSQCFIMAPYAGRIVRRIANQYENMTVGAPVIQIAESGPVRLELLVPSAWLRWLQKGSTFTIHVDELGTDFKASITTIGARVDAASQTIDVRAGIAGAAPGLLPGMSGTADFGSH